MEENKLEKRLKNILEVYSMDIFNTKYELIEEETRKNWVLKKYSLLIQDIAIRFSLYFYKYLKNTDEETKNKVFTGEYDVYIIFNEFIKQENEVTGTE